MKTIPLSQGLVTVVDDADYERLAGFKWHATRNSRKRKWYAARSVPKPGGGQTKLRMHRVILNAPQHSEVDHKDGDGLNNRRSNLRLATSTQNKQNRSRNRGKKSAAGYKGVDHIRTGLKPYKARIYQGNREIMIGRFLTAEEAARAYDAKATELFGEFAKLNFTS